MGHPAACSECGAAEAEGESCQELLRRLLAQTSTAAAEYGLAMACFTLQHPGGRPDRALAWAHLQLTLALDPRRPLEESSRLARARFDRQRAGGAPAAPPAPRRVGSWRLTIRDLGTLPDGSRAERLLIWARATLADLAADPHETTGSDP